MRSTIPSAVASVLVAASLLAACSSGSSGASGEVGASGAAGSAGSADTTEASAGGSTSAPSDTTDDADRTSMRGQRYCEVLVVRPADGTISADVYNTWPLNDCPADAWAKLDASAIAAEQGAPAAILNGPRYWLMDSIAKAADPASLPRGRFGDLEMFRQASVELGPLADAATPYRPHAVDRKASFTFDEGATVFELHDPAGATYLMQTWSQMVDTGLTEGDLAGLGSRLALPDGWTFTSRTLDAPVVVDTTGEPAQVLMDDLRNSYSRIDPS